MKKAFLLAHPAGHSISPVMHNAAFHALGIAAEYRALDISPDALADTVETLCKSDVIGANVTIPHKLAVMPFMDELSPDAEAIGAVNTVVNKSGYLFGHNTDASGYLRALKEDANFDPADKNVVVLGAGGAARAVVYALIQAGAKQIAIHNRTQEKAETLIKTFKDDTKLEIISHSLLEDFVHTCDLLINTTSVGMEKSGKDTNESPLPEGILPETGFVSDIVYRPAKTKLLRNAASRGLSVQNGLPMLVYQGAESFRYWTAQDAPISVMFGAVNDVLDS